MQRDCIIVWKGNSNQNDSNLDLMYLGYQILEVTDSQNMVVMVVHIILIHQDI